jgi:sulfur carrier protein ThiS
MNVQLPDGSMREVPENATVADVAAAIGKRLAKDALAGKVNGKVVDVYAPVSDGAKVEIITPKSEAGLDTIRHSTAHLMAMAVQELYPGTQVTIGPRSLPRPARPVHRPPRRLQADVGRRRVLARRRAQRDAAAHLRHRVFGQGGARRAPQAARGGEEARPPQARQGARPLSLPSVRARRGVLDSKGTTLYNALSQTCASCSAAATATSRSRRRCSTTRAVGDLRALGQVPREHVPRARQRDEASTTSRSSR